MASAWVRETIDRRRALTPPRGARRFRDVKRTGIVEGFMRASARASARSMKVHARGARARCGRTQARPIIQTNRSETLFRRRVSRASTDEDGYWVPGPFLRPEGSPAAEAYTGPTVWRLMQAELVESGVEQIAPASAKAMSESDGWTLLDVRPTGDYEQRHCWGAVNAQYYRALDAMDPRNWANSALSALIFPERLTDGKGYLNVTENENFIDEILESVEWGSKLILYDDVGGVLGEPGVNYENGVQTPSLMALYELAARGWGTENLLHMAGGLTYWDEVEQFDCGEIPKDDA